MRNPFKALFTKNPRLKTEIATRERAFGLYRMINGLIAEYDEVMNRLGLSYDSLAKLLYDPDVFACVQSRKAGVLSLEWEIARGDAKTEESEVVEKALRELDMHRIITDMLDAPLWGRAPMEIIWEVRDGLWLPKDIVGKRADWFRFDQDSRMRFLSVDSPMEGEEIADGKFIVPRFNATYSNPYGEKLLSRVWWPVWWKKAGWKFWSIKAEKYGIPTLAGTVPRGTSEEEVTKFLNILANSVQDSAMVFDDGRKVEILQASGNGGTESYPDLIHEANADIAKVILGHSAAADSTPGKLGNETMATDVRRDIVDGDRRMVERAMNELLQWIHFFNFSTGEPPKFSLFEEEEIDKTLAERDAILVQAMASSKLSLSKKYWMKAHGLDDNDIVEIEPEPEPEPFFPGPEGYAPEGNKPSLPPGQEKQAAIDQAKAQEQEGEPGKTEAKGQQESKTLEFAEGADPLAALSIKVQEAAAKPFDDMTRRVYEEAMKADTPEELWERLLALYPTLDVSEIQQTLTDSGFVAAVKGFAEAELRASRVARLRIPKRK